MPLSLIRRPAFFAHFRGLDSISPTVLPAHTFILSEPMPVNPPLKVITQRYPRFILFLRAFISGNARYLSCAIPFVIHCFAHVIIARSFIFAKYSKLHFHFENKCYSS